MIIPSAKEMIQGVVLQNNEAPWWNATELEKKNFNTLWGKLL